MLLILIIILLILALGGGVWAYPTYGYGGLSPLIVVLIIVALLFVFGVL